MPRNNEERLGAIENTSPPIQNQKESSLEFVLPTEIVKLPSKGRFYTSNHPLYGKKEVEIKSMTAKEEDILTSQSLLRKGIAIDRLIKSILVNNDVNPDFIFTCDRNAIIIKARITGYGAEYQTKLQCPSCGEVVEYEFNLDNLEINYGDESCVNSEGEFVIELPQSKVSVSCCLLNGEDERELMQATEKKKKLKLPETQITDQFRKIIKAINGKTDKNIINKFIDNMPLRDTRHLRNEYNRITPNIDMTQEFTCSLCGDIEEVVVPLGPSFFWSK